MEIERIDHKWSSEHVREYCDLLRYEIDRAMAIPEWMMRSPDRYAKARREAYERTEIMRRELAHLMATHCFPRIVLR